MMRAKIETLAFVVLVGLAVSFDAWAAFSRGVSKPSCENTPGGISVFVVE